MPPQRPDEREAIVLEHALRRDVRDRGARFDSMQAELAEGVRDRSGDRARREAPPACASSTK